MRFIAQQMDDAESQGWLIVESHIDHKTTNASFRGVKYINTKEALGGHE
jgi:hypothetical protein